MAGAGIQAGMNAMIVVLRPWVASHAETQDRFSAHLEGELRGREAKRVARHLALCPICREALRSLAKTLERLRSLGRGDAVPPPGPSVTDAVIDRIRLGGP
jgi:predicted anti-sigma-YlaC factor YlaD